MTLDDTIASLEQIEGDFEIQNYIAQANARYILLNTGESRENFPNYTFDDSRLNILGFFYLQAACHLFENGMVEQAVPPMEKGASILEYVNGSKANQAQLSRYFGLISAMAYYVSFQYSKSFILIGKVEGETVIARLISNFLKRNYTDLLSQVNEMVVDEAYQDRPLAEGEDREEFDRRIYEVTIAKALSQFVTYFFYGDSEALASAKAQLTTLLHVSSLLADPSMWWVIRLLLLISDGFKEASLWNALAGHFDTDEVRTKAFIQALVFHKTRSIGELFSSQRKSLDRVLSNEANGAIVSIPTSSGKTKIAEIAILHSLINRPEGKVLFIAPYRSLAFEIESSLDEVFRSLGAPVSHLYGGSLFSKLDEQIIDESAIIVVTPEKAKAILRSDEKILEEIGLIVIDECHLIGPDKRSTVNEVFYEELRHFAEKNGARFLLLSAVLPNPEDLAQWLVGKANAVYKDVWRPSDQRLGTLEWDGSTVNLEWQSTDTERKSYNNRFITQEITPPQGQQRVPRHFPGDKNQAVAATAFKLRNFGPVLIFVGLKDSCFTMGSAYMQALGPNPPDHPWKNTSDWKAFELASIENFGKDNLWLSYARKGVILHNADLHVDVRLPLERMMRKDKPLVIIATSTLGQGVNLGVSTVIFSTLYQAGNEVHNSSFWNIAGRAGRAFVDHEGKILVAIDTSDRSTPKARWKNDKNRRMIGEYFDKTRMDPAISGLLQMIAEIKSIADVSEVDFDMLFQMISENHPSMKEVRDEIVAKLDWIDDSLLTIHAAHNPEEGQSDTGWIDDHFRKSLAVIQAGLYPEKYPEITSDVIIKFTRARVAAILAKIGEDRSRWQSVASSGIPLETNLQIDERMPAIVVAADEYLRTPQMIVDKIALLGNIEAAINDVNELKAEYLDSEHLAEIRELWLSGVSMAQISRLDNADGIVTRHYSFCLPWILNGISRKLRVLGHENQAQCVEDLSLLVEMGLPNLKSVKVYQAGIRARAAAKEIADLLDEEPREMQYLGFKQRLIQKSESLKANLSSVANEWLELLKKYAIRDRDLFTAPEGLVLKGVPSNIERLILRRIKGKQYIMSPDLRYYDERDVPDAFASLNNFNGIYLQYNRSQGTWSVVNENPYVQRDIINARSN